MIEVAGTKSSSSGAGTAGEGKGGPPRSGAERLIGSVSGAVENIRGTVVPQGTESCQTI